MNSRSSFFSCCSYLLSLCLLLALNVAPGNVLGIPVFQFGDSLTDTGNRNIMYPERTPVEPYGMTFFHHPANRISDGRLIVDFIAEQLTSSFLNPYLENSTYTNGVNFAVCGATSVDSTIYSAMNSVRYLMVNNQTKDFGTQVDWLLEFKSRSQESEEMVKQALYVFEIAGNDYARMWDSHWIYDEVEPNVGLVVEGVGIQTRRVYAAGGRNFMIMNLALQGCAPRYFRKVSPDDEYDEMGCIMKMKKVADEHNVKLRALVNELQGELKDATIVYADFHGIMYEIYDNAASYGITNRRDPCCGIATPELNVDCGTTKEVDGILYEGTACSNPSEYLFWNDNHYTDHVNGIAAKALLSQLRSQLGGAFSSMSRSSVL